MTNSLMCNLQKNVFCFDMMSNCTSNIFVVFSGEARRVTNKETNTKITDLLRHQLKHFT